MRCIRCFSGILCYHLSSFSSFLGLPPPRSLWIPGVC